MSAIAAHLLDVLEDAIRRSVAGRDKDSDEGETR